MPGRPARGTARPGARVAAALCFVAALWAQPAAALARFTLQLDPTQSSLTIFEVIPVLGPIPLSGSLTIQFDEAPAPGVGTGFEITALDATGADTSLSLDTTSFTPTGTAGSGVLFFTDFMVLDGTMPAIPPATGSVPVNVGVVPGFGSYTADASGNVSQVTFPFDFDIASLTSAKLVFVAIPEPGTLLLVLTGALVASSLRRARTLTSTS